MNPELTHYASETIRAGSKSFAVAASLFDPDTRRSAMMLYAWCRYCDDLIDGQHLGYQHSGVSHHQPQDRIGYLRSETQRALAGKPVEHPAFAALQTVVLRHRIPERYPLEHLEGFAKDVRQHKYDTFEDILAYCYQVAGVVGIMMARIMGVQDDEVLDHACDLGIAFQLTNIARDIVDDARIGRCYLPGHWLEELELTPQELTDPKHWVSLATLAHRLITAAEPYYRSARIGLRALPFRSAWAVATAHGVYREIGVKIIDMGADAWQERVSTSTADKLRLLALGLMATISSRYAPPSPRPTDLWQRPA